MDIPVWQYAVSMGGYFIILMVIVEFMRKHYRFSSFFWIATLVTVPLWVMNVDGWFRWAKVCSVIFPTIFLGFCRVAVYEDRRGEIWDKIKGQWTLWFFYGILFLNIMEATIKDFTEGNAFNGMVGLMLCATIPLATGKKYWKFTKQEPGDLLVFTTAAWNFMYTTWNLCFVFGERPNPKYFASSICILAAAEIYPILKNRPELYVMARVYTLATHEIIRSSTFNLIPNLMNATSWKNPTLVKWWGVANFILMVPYLFWHIYQIKTGKADKSFFRGRPQTD